MQNMVVYNAHSIHLLIIELFLWWRETIILLNYFKWRRVAQKKNLSPNFNMTISFEPKQFEETIVWVEEGRAFIRVHHQII